MNVPIRFALVGCGKIAPRHAEEMVRHGLLTAACDIVHQKADAFSNAYNCRAYTDLGDLLREEKPDVLSVCTPNGLHTLHATMGLQAGAHVLCEKPLATSTADANNMIRAAKECNRKLFVVKSTRYNPALAALKDIVESGRLGSIYSFQLDCFWNRPDSYYADSWRGDEEMDGGTLFTQFSHYIDALLWLLGDVASVTGFRKNQAHRGVMDFEDTGVVAMEMASGAIGGINWSVNSYRKNMEVSLTVLAEKGSLCIAGEYMNQVRYQLTDGTDLPVPEQGTANDYGFYKGSMSNHHRVYENLVRALASDKHPFASAEDGLRTVALIERIYKSVSLR